MEDYRDNRDRDDKEPYQVERISTVLAVACMFLSALYTIFAVLLFLCYASEEVLSDGVESDTGATHAKTPLTADAAHPGAGFLTMENSAAGESHNPGFITMENSSQGTEQ